MKAVVTGAKGFLGKELVSQLLLSNSVVAQINRVNEVGLFSGVKLSEKESIPKICLGLKKFKPDIIFHLASNTSIKSSWVNPFDFIHENLMLVENLLEAIDLSNENPTLVLLSSSSIYDTSTEQISETYRISPNSPYAISKLVTEHIILRYPKSIIVRPFFTVGSARRGDVIDEWLSAILKINSSGSKGILNVGNLNIERDYLDVFESARLLIQISKKGASGEVYNLCSGTSTNLKEVCNALIKLTKSESLVSVISDGTIDPNSRLRVIGNPSKLLKLGLNPKFDLEASLINIIRDRTDQDY